MRIILDANILYSNTLIQSRLPSAINTFLQACEKRGHEIIITSTTKLEFDRKQKEVQKQKTQDIISASKLFDEFNIKYETFDPEGLVKFPDLIHLLKEQNNNITFIEPELSDFEYAHEKACLHLAPHPPDIKSDEMRDLIVWEIALRIASDNSGAMLISNDRLHLNQSGDDEASKVNLIRVNSLESALDYLEVETPNGHIIKLLLEKIWPTFLQNSIPVKDKPKIKGISNVRFIQGKNGPSDAIFHLKVMGLKDKEFQTDITINFNEITISNIHLNNTLYDGNAIGDKTLGASINIDFFENDYLDRANSLKNLMK
jgi:hypothetical protein